MGGRNKSREEVGVSGERKEEQGGRKNREVEVREDMRKESLLWNCSKQPMHMISLLATLRH